MNATFVTVSQRARGEIHGPGVLAGILVPWIANGRIRELDWVANPDKLGRVRPRPH